MPHTNEVSSGKHWIDNPTAGALFVDQICSSGQKAPHTARRITVIVAGVVYLIPPGQTAADEYPWGDGVSIPAGAVITQQCDGMGASNAAAVVAQF